MTLIGDNSEIAERFRDVYRNALRAKGFANNQEAYDLEVVDSQVSGYIKPKSDKNLPVALAAKSLVRDEIAAWLATECGGYYIKACGHRDGSICNEMCELLKSVGEIYVADEAGDVKATLKYMLAAQQALAAGIKELEVVQ